MRPIPVSYDELVELHTNAIKEKPYIIPSTIVIVEFLYLPSKYSLVSEGKAEQPKLLTALIPATASFNKQGYMVLTYTKYVDGKDLKRFTIHYKGNMPTMYLLEELTLECRLFLLTGGLLLWEKDSDVICKDEDGPEKWSDMFNDDIWYAWSNKDQDYTVKYCA